MSQPIHPTENVVRGALLALLVLPVGVAVWVAVQSFGIVIGIVAFGISFGAYWLYQRGAGGVISRAGAWVVTAIVVVTLVLSIIGGMMADFALGISKQVGVGAWDVFFNSAFLGQFGEHFGELFAANLTFYLIAIAIAAYGAYGSLRRVFRSTSSGRPATAAYPPASSGPVTYRNDVDAAPTGSADDKTPPPASGS
jgi:hypothetical protein